MENGIGGFEPTGLDAVICEIRDAVVPKWPGWAITTHVLKDHPDMQDSIGLSFFRAGVVKRFAFAMHAGKGKKAALRYFMKASPNG